MTVMSVAKEKATMYTETFTVASSLSQSDMLQCSEDKFMVFRATWLLQEKRLRKNESVLKFLAWFSDSLTLHTVPRNRLPIFCYRRWQLSRVLTWTKERREVICCLTSSRPPSPPSKLIGPGVREYLSQGKLFCRPCWVHQNPTQGFSENVVRLWCHVIDLSLMLECRQEEERERERLERSKVEPQKPLQDREQPGFLIPRRCLAFSALGSKNITPPWIIWASLNRFLFLYSGS